jgi:ATP-dependent Clp protease ATP-binding subunit ClpA
MRDVRDAKAMAGTLRAALTAKGLKITVSQSQEMIAEIFGVADWNALAAAIRQKADVADQNASAPPLPMGEGGPDPLFSRELQSTLRHALACANGRSHQHTTLEHLLLALTFDGDAAAMMRACKVDLVALQGHLTNFIDNELKTLVIDDGRESRPTVGFQRVVGRAVLHVKGLRRDTVTGMDILMAMYPETESPAGWLLGEQEMTQQDAAKYIQGIARESVSRGRTKPVAAEKVKRRAPPKGGKAAKKTRRATRK